MKSENSVLQCTMTSGIPISNEDLIKELQRVATLLNNDTLVRSEFAKHGKYGTATIEKRFGSWNGAVALAGLNPLRQCDSSVRRTYSRTKFTRRQGGAVLKLAILKRDRYKCLLCGASPANDDDVELHIDHIKPVARGGKTTEFNLWVLCGTCNRKKGKTYDVDVAKLAANYIAKRYFESVSK